MSAHLEKPHAASTIVKLAPAGAVSGRAPSAAMGTVASRAASRKTSLHRQRQWALWGSYAALAVFVVMFLMPPFYTLMTSLKSSAEISATRSRKQSGKSSRPQARRQMCGLGSPAQLRKSQAQFARTKR
jgi:hypothetical protein